MTKPEGGFVFVSAMALISAWWAYKRRFIELGDLRVWLASHELIAKRCALGKGRIPAFRIEEIASLVAVRDSARIERAIGRLERVGLLAWSRSRITYLGSCADMKVGDATDLLSMIESVTNHRRKVPVPRRLLRYLASARRPAIIATVMGHLFRCLYYRDRACSPVGLCKATWIAGVFKIDVRNVKAARKLLEGEGILLRHETAQWRMNRWGPSIEINLAWAPSTLVKRYKSPPRPMRIHSVLPPPESNRELSSKVRTRNSPAEPVSGFFDSRRAPGPTLRNVRREDLRDGCVLMKLYDQAMGEGMLSDSECDRLRFFAAAEHANAKGTRNPAGLFVAVLRRGLWNYISNVEEEAGRRRLESLRRFPDGDPAAGCPRQGESISAPLQRASATLSVLVRQLSQQFP